MNTQELVSAAYRTEAALDAIEEQYLSIWEKSQEDFATREKAVEMFYVAKEAASKVTVGIIEMMA